MPVSPASDNLGLQWRNGAAGNVFNSIVTNTGSLKTIILDTGATGAPGFDAIDNANAGLSNVVCTTLANGAPLAAGENLLVSNGNALNLVLGGTAAGADTVYSAGFNNLINRDQTFNPQGNAGASSSLRSRPRRSTRALRQGSWESAAAFRRSVRAFARDFRGAFSSVAPAALDHGLDGDERSRAPRELIPWQVTLEREASNMKRICDYTHGARSKRQCFCRLGRRSRQLRAGTSPSTSARTCSLSTAPRARIRWARTTRTCTPHRAPAPRRAFRHHVHQRSARLDGRRPFGAAPAVTPIFPSLASNLKRPRLRVPHRPSTRWPF